MDTILDQAKKFLMNQLGLSEIENDSTLLMFDSLDIIELIEFLESCFNVRLNYMDYQQCNNIYDLCKLVKNLC